ncbi:unnamed protein product [Polarella glacialis]|uniref:Uncharacterized protein n=1 Tax=Polarella glacialis TaxID=89957 RepID=A0A813DFM5_POLGL|nr:unnamed protein product [Polarella glacialis]
MALARRAAGRWGTSQQLDDEKPVISSELFSAGCGHLGAELFCALLGGFGIRSVLDVRELDHSAKRPWFNRDALELTMRDAGLDYLYIGDKSSLESVASLVAGSKAPVCLLGVRALARECPRLALCEALEAGPWKLRVFHLQLSPEAPPELRLLPHPHSAVLGRRLAAAKEVADLQDKLEVALGFAGSWRDRVLRRHKMVRWEDWDLTRRLPSAEEGPLAIQLPFDTLLLIIPQFMAQRELYALQQAALPGAVEYCQPRRQIRNPDGSFVQFNEHFKEAWLCDDYDYRDSRRVQQPRLHVGQQLPCWAQELQQRAEREVQAPFNSLMCRWEPRGVHLKDGPHTYATKYGWGDEAVIGLLAVGPTREYRIHAIPWYHGRGRREVVAVNIPLAEGMLVALGGPLKERWLYAQPRDEESAPERIQFTLQLHADPELRIGAGASRSCPGTEDGEVGAGCSGAAVSGLAVPGPPAGELRALQTAQQPSLAESQATSRKRWHRA